MIRRGRRRHVEVDAVEELEKRIRELKAENRALRRRLRKIDKGYKKSFREDTPDEEYEEDKGSYEVCKECGKGTLEGIAVAGRYFERCGICGWRSKAQKI